VSSVTAPVEMNVTEPIASDQPDPAVPCSCTDQHPGGLAAVMQSYVRNIRNYPYCAWADPISGA
jgi:hypothetical protein